jgi:quercetin dioxygenase-like cupin family protein
MAKIEFVHDADNGYTLLWDMLGGNGVASTIPESEQRGIESRSYFPGGPDDMQMFEVKCAPNLEIHPHAHVEDEIMYVIEGSVEFGRNSYPAGSAVRVPGQTLYSFRAGPDGLRFLNFRARADRVAWDKDEFLALKRQND